MNTIKYIGTKIGHFTPYTHKIAKLSDFYSKNVKLDDFYPPTTYTLIFVMSCVFSYYYKKTSNLTIFLWKSSNLAISLNIGFIEVSIFCVSCVHIILSINSTKLVSLWYIDSLQSNLLFSSFVTVTFKTSFLSNRLLFAPLTWVFSSLNPFRSRYFHTISVNQNTKFETNQFLFRINSNAIVSGFWRISN